MVPIIAAAIFVLGYVGILLEHPIHINKSGFALFTGAVLWILVALTDPGHLNEHLLTTGADIFNITVFLLAAMALVEILIHYRLFDIIKSKLVAFKLEEKSQFTILAVLAFFLSGIISDITTAIIMIQIARKFFSGKNFVLMTIMIVIAANSGGSYSPIGAVSTILLWISGKFGAFDIISGAFFPAVAIFATGLFFLRRKIGKEEMKELQAGETAPERMTRGEILVTCTVFGSFLLPLVVKTVGLPPVIGILLGVGITWLVVDSLKNISNVRTHMTATIESMVQKTDIASITFFIGILLSVAALHTLGVLDYISHFIYGPTQEFMRVVIGNIGLGLISSVLDNIPLTAIAITILQTTDTSLWVLLAICVGNGGAMLPIGSVAGVVAMGLVKELTVGTYIKHATLPLLLGFTFAIGIWWLQFMVF